MNEAESGGEPEAERSEVARPERSEDAAEPERGERGPEPARAPQGAGERTAEPREPADEGVPESGAEVDPAEALGAGDAPGGTDAGEAAALAEAEESAEPEGPKPLGVELRPTGHAPVDARLRRLAEADRLTVSGHLEVYEDVHSGLRETLAELDRTPGG